MFLVSEHGTSLLTEWTGRYCVEALTIGKHTYLPHLITLLQRSDIDLVILRRSAKIEDADP